MRQAGLEVWPDVLSHLRRQHPSICRRWFEEELRPVEMRDGTLSIRAQSDFHRDYLTKFCSVPFSEALQSVTGRLLTVRFLGPNDDVNASRHAALLPTSPSSVPPVVDVQANGTTSGSAQLIEHIEHKNGHTAAAPHEASETPNSPRYQPAQPVSLSPAHSSAPLPRSLPRSPRAAHEGTLVINPDYDFNSFVVGPSNRLAHAASVGVAANPGTAYNPLFIHGNVGLGKTHLLQAICLNILKNNPDAVVCYLSCDGFMTEFVAAVKEGRMNDFRHRYRDVDVLVVDDIHDLGKRDQTQEEFFHTFNALFQASKQIVLSSDAPPEAIPDLQDRLVSRFKWGLVASVDAPSFETRIEILKTKASIRGFELPDEVAFHVASHLDSNVRELEGAVVKLQMFSMVEGKPITMELAAEALGLKAKAGSTNTSIQSIIEAVVGFYDIRLSDLQSKKRTRSIALPRQVCMYLAKHNTHHSLQEIGGYFGGRDHTTVMHAVKTVHSKRAADEQFNTAIKTLENKLRPASSV